MVGCCVAGDKSSVGRQAVGHWEQIGAERRRRQGSQQETWLRKVAGRVLVLVAVGALWALVIVQLGKQWIW